MGKISDLVKRLKEVKHIEIIACVALIVVVLAVYFSCTSCASSGAESEKDLSGLDYCTAMQYRLESVVSEIDGVGSASVAINWDKSVQTSFGSGAVENPKAVGAVIVCDGGNQTKVKLDVIYAVSTLLDLSIEKIIVYPKSK